MNRYKAYAIFLSSVGLLGSVSCSTTKHNTSIDYFDEVSSKFFEECPFSTGDDVSAVKSFYGIEADPLKPDRSEHNSGPHYIYNFSEQIGVWVFFDANKKISSLRFQKPFSGSISGVPPGASKQALQDIKGPPKKIFEGLFPLDTFKNSNRIVSNTPLPKLTAWTYPDPSFVRYDYEKKTEIIQVILSHSCASGS